MSKKTRIWLVIAASLILLGGIIFTGVMAMLKWDFTKLSTVGYETNTVEIGDTYRDISVLTDTADVVLLPSSDGKTSVVCHEQKHMTHSVAVADGVLTVAVQDTRKWYEHIGFDFGSPKITLYLPAGEYGDLTVELSTGDVEIRKDFTFESVDVLNSTGNVIDHASAESVHIKVSTGNIRVTGGISADTLELAASTGRVTLVDVTCVGDMGITVTTGDVALIDVTCRNLTTSGSTGDISLGNVIAGEKIAVVRSTGDVELDRCDAAELNIRTDTGDITGTLLSDKVFIPRSDTGDIEVPRTTEGGQCEITTDTGDIRISIQ